ncbi:MAG: mechanosensitive ion channel protein [Flavobacteriales bacterium]|nr:MAG: mechanosensitive ion channel protein [Flavobacteriales bacterium]
MEKISEKIAGIDWIVLGAKFITAILILVIGLWIVKSLTKFTAKLMDIKKFDRSLKGFILSVISTICKVIVILAAAATMGLDLSMLGTIIAASVLAIGMALQGSLANIAGGALIMVLKPFKVGDYISAQGKEGFVKQIELFNTVLNTIDNKEVIIPNGALSNGTISNFSSEEKRRVDITFGVSYDADIKQTKEVLMAMVKSCPYIINPAPQVVVGELADSSVNFITRTWVKSKDYWDAYFYIMEHGKIELDKAGISIPFPQMDVHMQN